ncbi:response regulator transcription factor [bacterium]|nr:response regulator transcription factor [bacterium]
MSDGVKFQKVLLVEDERHLATAIKVALEKLNLSVDHCTTLEEAQEKLITTEYDLCLLDRMLPDGDGIDLCQEIKATSNAPMILILSAKGEVEDRIEGLDEGADDYLPKPFSYQELEARIKALQRRFTKATILPFRPKSGAESIPLWSNDPKNLRVFGHKGWVELTQLEHKLLTKFLEHPGSALSRDALLKDVWGFQWLPKTRTVDFFMSRIRRSFELDPEKPKHFITVRGVGYRFEP